MSVRIGLVLIALLLTGSRADADDPPERRPAAYLILLTPADVEPPAGAVEQLRRVGLYTESFFETELKRWKYPPARAKIFARDEGDAIRVLLVRGDRPRSDPKYYKSSIQDATVLAAMKQYRVPAHKNFWWVWVYTGDPAKPMSEYKGNGSPQGGGWSVCNFDATVPPIDPKRPMAWDQHERFTLKGCTHEFGHALGLPHMGFRRKDDLGNELMGPRTVLFRREFPKDDRVYLSEATAAMLWKHPLFTGTTKDRFTKPDIKLAHYQAVFNKARNAWSVTGQVESSIPAHTAVVLDETEDHAKEGGRYRKAYASRVGPDGRFAVGCDEPTGKPGRLRLLFCLDNGMLAGSGAVSDLNLDVAFSKSYERVGQGYQMVMGKE